MGLVDVDPISMGPTWRGNRIVIKGVSKGLDCFLVSYTILKGFGGYRV